MVIASSRALADAMLDRFLPASLRWRLAATHALLVIVLMLGFGVFLVGEARQLQEDRLRAQLGDQARVAAAVIEPLIVQGAGDDAIDREIDRISVGVGTRLEVLAADGRVIADTAAVSSDSGSSPTGQEIAAIVPAAGANGVSVRAALPISEVDASIRDLRRNVLLVAAFASVVAAIVAVWVGRQLTRPLEVVRRQATRVARGDLESTIAPVMPKELADLAGAFNLMTARVRDLVQEGAAARARLETIFANLSDGVAIVDEQSKVIGLNRAAGSILGADVRDAVGRPFSSIVTSADLVQLLRDAFGDGDLKLAVIEDNRPGRTIEAHAQAVSTDNGRIGIVVIRDLTELRRLELVRREFVANVSHELRTPLASIRALVETLESGAALDPELGPRFMSQAIGEVDRVSGLVDELLDLARLESGRLSLKREAIPAAPLLHGAMERLRPQTERADLRLFAAFRDDLPDVNVDRGRIEQVMLNLIHNAIKFTPAGGVITVRATEAGGMVRVEIADTGVGIPEADVPRLFERFYKSDRARRSEGSGLGLAIAKHIILAHGGAIWAASEPGAGATFSFTLPLADQRRDERGSSAS